MFDAEIPGATAAPDGLMLRSTITEVEARRALALARHGEAFDALAAAVQASAEAVQRTGNGPRAAVALLAEKMHCRDSEDPRAFYMEHVRKDLDRSIWRFLVDFMGLERIMDRTERDAFRKALDDDPPPATAENCASTFARLIGDADTIFRRGVALAFSSLDRRFRSHDGFKIGARIVLSYAITEYGGWNSNRQESLRDVERAFYELQGKPQPDQAAGIVGRLEMKRREMGWGRHAYEAEDDLFKIRAFKNGNVHLWFKRDDLVEKVNKVLAEYYGANLGAGPDATEAPADRKTGIAPRFGLFETPEQLAANLRSAAGVYSADQWGGREPFPLMRVLEPSAGRGRIALPAHRAGHDVTCVEIQPDLAAELGRHGLRVVQGDFMDLEPSRLGLFDAITMNPPFDRGRDCEHVAHAFRFLKPGGTLAAIMSASVEFREDKRTTDFRAFVERFGGKFKDLPPGSFAESGTNVNTVMLTIRAPRA